MRSTRRLIGVSLLALCAALISPSACIAEDNLPAVHVVDNGPISAPTDEATLNKFLDKLKLHYIGKPAGLVTKEQGAIAFTAHAQDVQDSSRYCQGWVKVATLSMKVATPGKCDEGMPILRCEPAVHVGEKGLTCYLLGGIKSTNLKFVTISFWPKKASPVYVNFMTYADFEAMEDRYAADPANDPAHWTFEDEKTLNVTLKKVATGELSPAVSQNGAEKPTPEQQAEIDTEVEGDVGDNKIGNSSLGGNASPGSSDLDGLRSDYAARHRTAPTTQGELEDAIANLTLQLGDQVVDFGGGTSPGLGGFYEKVSTEGIVPDTERCGATVTRLLGDCRRSTNTLGCSGINIYAMNERQKHTTFCYELWGVAGTKLHFVMAYAYWDAEDVIRYGGTLTIAAYRGLRQHEAEDQEQLGEGMKLLDEIMSGSQRGRCALATNGTTGAKTPGCP